MSFRHKLRVLKYRWYVIRRLMKSPAFIVIDFDTILNVTEFNPHDICLFEDMAKYFRLNLVKWYNEWLKSGDK